jgi:hypothetical protein
MEVPAEDHVSSGLPSVASSHPSHLQIILLCHLHLRNQSIETGKMRAFYRLLATTSSSPGRAVPLSLLPPIPLYRRLLRAQRKLPGDMRVLGDEYIKSEFRAHRNVENPLHIVSITNFVIVPILIRRADWLPYLMAIICSEN